MELILLVNTSYEHGKYTRTVYNKNTASIGGHTSTGMGQKFEAEFSHICMLRNVIKKFSFHSVKFIKVY